MKAKVWLTSLIMMLFYACAGHQSAVPPAVPHEVGVAYMNLETGEILAYNGNQLFHAASTMKTPIMFELFKMRDDGVINLDTEIPVTNKFTSIADGSLYSLPIHSGKDDVLFPYLGKKASYRLLIDRMITHSSNLATDVLIEYTRPDSISKTLRRIDANGVLVIRGVEDLKAYEIGLNNMTSAYGMLKVMEAVYRSDLVADSSHQEMLAILKRQVYNGMIPAGLPEDVIVAHKTGSITRIAHDAAIVMPPDSPPFILVILTKGWDSHAQAQRVGARIAAKIYDYHRGLLQRTDIVVPDLLKD